MYSFLTFGKGGELVTQLRIVFNLSGEAFSLWKFIGVDVTRLELRGTYCTQEILAEVRMDIRANRERDIAAAGPVTAATKKAAA